MSTTSTRTGPPQPLTKGDGFAVLRGLLDVDALQGAAMEELRDLGATDGSLTNRGQPRYVHADHDSEATYLPQLARSEELALIFEQPAVLSVVRGLLDSQDIFVHPNKWIRAMPPQPSELYLPPGVHQDFPELQGSTRQMTMWAPLFRVTPETGSLPIYSAPQPRRVLPLELNSHNNSGWAVDPTLLGAPSQATLEPGDVLVFNTLTPHGGARNVADGWRVSVEARFQPAEDPICENQLVSFLGMDWETHRDGWTRLKESWRTTTPPSIEFDPTWERWRDAAAIRAGEHRDPSGYRALQIAADFAVSEDMRDHASRLLDSLDEAAHESS